MVRPREIVVFLGPTLPACEASKHLAGIYLPPAEQGCFVRAIWQYRPEAIVLIDGQFGRVPAVRHKEIIWALAQGIPVFGASSMGAIRASELAEMGMQGHGLIYRWFRATALADDDEVAVSMSPVELGAKPLSEALINIRLTLRRAARVGIFSPVVRGQLEDLAREAHFRDRTYPDLLERARETLPGRYLDSIDRFEKWYPMNLVDQKQADAVSLLHAIASTSIPLEYRAPRPFQMTEAWAFDLASSNLDLPD
jgi:hypothetical protein